MMMIKVLFYYYSSHLSFHRRRVNDCPDSAENPPLLLLVSRPTSMRRRPLLHSSSCGVHLFAVAALAAVGLLDPRRPPHLAASAPLTRTAAPQQLVHRNRPVGRQHRGQ